MLSSALCQCLNQSKFCNHECFSVRQSPPLDVNVTFGLVNPADFPFSMPNRLITKRPATASQLPCTTMPFIFRSRLPTCHPRQPSTFEQLEFLAWGRSGVVYGIDKETVLKEYANPNSNEDVIERQAYDRLGSHPNIAKLHRTTSNGSIILERGQVLRSVCQSSSKHVPLQEKLSWLRDLASRLLYIHKMGIIHADVGCHNAILTKKERVKIIDFEGCSIDGGEADSCYEWFSYRPSIPATSKQTDIFAFGCAMYEIMTGKLPHGDLETSECRDSLVEQRYKDNQFPDVANMPLGQLMNHCWDGTINSMEQVIQALEMASVEAGSTLCLNSVENISSSTLARIYQLFT